jgi:hypothetical protein
MACSRSSSRGSIQLECISVKFSYNHSKCIYFNVLHEYFFFRARTQVTGPGVLVWLSLEPFLGMADSTVETCGNLSRKLHLTM